MAKGERIFLGVVVAAEIGVAVWNISLQTQLVGLRNENSALVKKLSQRTATLQTQITEANARIDDILSIPAISKSKEGLALRECMADFNKFYRTSYSQDAQAECTNSSRERRT